MKGTVKLQKCLLWIMVLLMLTTNYDCTVEQYPSKTAS